LKKIIFLTLIFLLLFANLHAQKDTSKINFGIRLSGGLNIFFSPKSYYHKKSPTIFKQLLWTAKISMTIADLNNEIFIGTILHCKDSINIEHWKTNYIFNKSFKISKTGFSGICVGGKHYFNKNKSFRPTVFLNMDFVILTTRDKGSFIVYPNTILTGFSDWRYRNFQCILGSGFDYKFCKYGSLSMDYGLSLNCHKFYSTNDDFHLYMQERNYGFTTIGIAILGGLTLDFKSFKRQN
jgi:hypothetical protein